MVTVGILVSHLCQPFLVPSTLHLFLFASFVPIISFLSIFCFFNLFPSASSMSQPETGQKNYDSLLTALLSALLFIILPGTIININYYIIIIITHCAIVDDVLPDW